MQPILKNTMATSTEALRKMHEIGTSTTELQKIDKMSNEPEKSIHSPVISRKKDSEASNKFREKDATDISQY